MQFELFTQAGAALAARAVAAGEGAERVEEILRRAAMQAGRVGASDGDGNISRVT